MKSCRARIALPGLLALFLVGGCSLEKDAPSAGAPAAVAPAAQAPADKAPAPLSKASARPEITRKVVYKAELSLEVRSPGDAQAKITALAEREGGFVANAAREDSEGRPSDVTLVLKVPAERFSAVLGEIRRLGTGKRAERIDSEDVTDEYVDLDARLRVQTRLEEQLLELMKTATTVEAALNVHKELANVRTEVEWIQGRKQLLEREVALSTIRVTLAAPPTQSVSVAKIGDSVSQASSDAVVVANGIVVGAIRLTGIFVPVAVLLGLPVLLAVLLVRRRMRRSRIDLSATLPG
jgi:hypothetical protein